jgi:predicted enzyme related to lactoylglutathione lyase
MAGGSVLVPKRLVSEDVGYMAVIRDTEGNRIGLLSKP